MTSKEIISKLDEMVTVKVNVLNYTMDKDATLEEQEEGWQRKFWQLQGMIELAQNIGKAWRIECTLGDAYTLDKLTIRS